MSKVNKNTVSLSHLSSFLCQCEKQKSIDDAQNVADDGLKFSEMEEESVCIFVCWKIIEKLQLFEAL